HIEPVQKKSRKSIDQSHRFGISLDLGTTTLAFYLVDLTKKEIIEEVSVLNKQAIFGADVISRIDYASRINLLTIHKTIIEQIKYQINYFMTLYQIKKIEKLVVAGNTVMSHIFLKVNPKSIGVIPFEPVFIDHKEITGKELGLPIEKIIVYPGISAFVGGDIVAGLLATGFLNESNSIKLFVDIGTNGEIILKNKTKLYSTSTAAGPAFEGAKIEMGLGGIEGAISKVEYKNNQLEMTTINNKSAIGICGSGLVDIINVLVDEGIIDETGAFDEEIKHNLAKHLKENKFYLNTEVYITQKDIREFQLAKAAISAGIETLINVAGLKNSDINEVLVAGGFGFYLSKINAINLGLLPFKSETKITNVGNSSGEGAFLGLIKEEIIYEGEKIAKEVIQIELAKNDFFRTKFIDNMGFWRD
ncbi:MAG: ATP-binding protein, partial [Acholeplasmataceae bacterium]|nr:ATP-binding protein [Acholeplasmataceae bacterium]